MRFLSLFAGIGGFDLGLERVGMECVGQVEIDPYCLAVLAHHWPNVKRIEDIRNVKGNEFGAVDLVCGGFPCQPFSCAGKRKGKADDRYLWPEMCRVIKACRPAWVLGENVAGIIGMELDKVLADLETIGYSVQCFVIPACAVDAHHRRDRVWIVGYSECPERRQDNAPWGHSDEGCHRKGQETSRSGEPSENVAHATRRGLGTDRGASGDSGHADLCGEVVADSFQSRLEGHAGDGAIGDEPGWNGTEPDGSTGETRVCRWPDEADWFAESGMGRLAHGVPNRVAQLRALGNAVVPQVVEQIGKAIMQAEQSARLTEGHAGEQAYNSGSTP